MVYEAASISLYIEAKEIMNVNVELDWILYIRSCGPTEVLTHIVNLRTYETNFTLASHNFIP